MGDTLMIYIKNLRVEEGGEVKHMRLQYQIDYMKFYTAVLYPKIDLATYDITQEPAINIISLFTCRTQDEVEHSHSPLLKYTVLMSGWVLRMASRTPGSKLDVGMELKRRGIRRRRRLTCGLGE